MGPQPLNKVNYDRNKNSLKKIKLRNKKLKAETCPAFKIVVSLFGIRKNSESKTT
jgi:hypothetical protein